MVPERFTNRVSVDDSMISHHQFVPRNIVSYSMIVCADSSKNNENVTQTILSFTFIFIRIPVTESTDQASNTQAQATTEYKIEDEESEVQE